MEDHKAKCRCVDCYGDFSHAGCSDGECGEC